jgi:hypothetical protein
VIDKGLPLDEQRFRACQDALGSALAMAQSWPERGDPRLKAKLALLVLKHAESGETNAELLRDQALESYFSETKFPAR